MTQARVLIVDEARTPFSVWGDFMKVAKKYESGKVIAELGEPIGFIKGGVSRAGKQSLIEVPSILMVRGFVPLHKDRGIVPLSREALFRRDRYVCAYCGKKFHEKKLTREHILPEARGGRATWMNLVTACQSCNNRKGCRTPEEAGMMPLYLPYVPNRYEGLILAHRRILSDQMEYLLAGVPQSSRLL